MKLPFSSEIFFEVFREYNEAIWPFQVVLTEMAILITVLALLKHQRAGMIAGIVLCFFWLWMGIVYHFLYFSQINPAAKLFGTLFIIQGLLLFYITVFRKKLLIEFNTSLNGILGLLLILFALLVYPLLGAMSGHTYPYNPTFGLPCPTTIFTLGILLWSKKRLPVYLLIIPIIWSFIGFTASFTMGVKEDTGLLIAVLIFVGMQFIDWRKNANH